ncbi:type II toxin-antitoxin system VapC family toxin [Microbacterium sp.]|uniref:type II toxin-antitoxin system VapC family toxin n=1 Tax=Microbacterium sp. TaxID=51671 RepID=UPI0039E40482
MDTNVLLDVVTNHPRWSDWSSDALARALDAGDLVINQLVFAELSVRFASEDELTAVIGQLRLIRENLPYEAAYPAAKAFADYRRRGGSRTAILPDFYIGAHAIVRGHTLLTRDARRYRTAFPTLRVIAPD